MNEFEKNQILKQVSSVLNICNQIVSRLSEIDCRQVTLHQDQQMFLDYSSSSSSVPPFDLYSDHNSDVSVSEFDSFDNNNNSGYWWDTPPSQFYQCVFDDDDKENIAVINAVDIDPLKNVADTTSVNLEGKHENEQMTADAIVTELPTTSTINSKITSAKLQTSVNRFDIQIGLTTQISANDSTDEEMFDEAVPEHAVLHSLRSEFVLMDSVLQFLGVAAPDAIYRPNWRQEEAKKLIHPLFYNLWNHCNSIFTEEKDDDTPKMAEPADIYHTIDLSCVNARFIQNIPKPNHYPVLGVSQDPDFYHKWYSKEDTTKHFLKSFPHGALYGYETNIGIVAPPTEPVHGYIWSERYGSFVLHAVQPGERARSSCRRRG